MGYSPQIMDIFQGWYKDGTEGTYDYRPLSPLYMLLRLVLVSTYFVLQRPSEYRELFATGMLHFFSDDVSDCKAVQAEMDESY